MKLGFFAYLVGVPQNNVLYGISSSSTAAAIFPQQDSYSGAGACVIAMPDMSPFSDGYNLGKLGPAFLDAAGFGKSCGRTMVKEIGLTTNWKIQSSPEVIGKVLYTFSVTNTGNVTLTNIVLEDIALDAAATCLVPSLAPGASTTCTGTHTITQDEANIGRVDNTATVIGTAPDNSVVNASDEVSTPLSRTQRLVSLKL